MPPQIVKLAGKDYVVVLKTEFQDLTRRAMSNIKSRRKPTAEHRNTKQDNGDVAEAVRLASKNEKVVSLADLRRELGL